MTPAPTIELILELYAARGGAHYGEGVSQLAHALQTATLAQRDGAPDALVAAALLHDVGHLVHEDDPAATGDADDRHEAVGARMLAAALGPHVAAPVALHVVAKRWLCAADPAYEAALSTASIASLRAQGGPLDDAARRRFEAIPSFDAAVRLRRWDDAAKDPSAVTDPLAAFEPLLRSVRRSG